MQMTIYIKEQIRIPIFLSILLISFMLSTGCSQDRYKDGVYTNEKYGFSFTIPENWRPVSEKEAELYPMLRPLSILDNRLIVTPSNPDEIGMVVSVMPMTEEQFNAMPWSQYTRSLRSMGNMVIEDDTKEYIGGFDVHWVSGNSPLHHNGVVLFISGGKVMQIFYWAQKPVREDIFVDIENIVLSLQKTS
jgi:hypothetical protein